MKFNNLVIALFAGMALAGTPDANQGPTVGYATLNGGTTGGKGGTSVTVTTLSALTSALADDTKKIVYVSGSISGNTVVKVGANKSVLGINGASLVGVGLRVLEKSNVIIRNLKISKVLADAGDAIGVQGTTVKNVWIDHVDLSSDQTHDKDYYDGLLDITHGVQYVSVTYSYFHDHWKGSLVGHSDSNGSEDTVLTVTYAYNWWKNINSRAPSYRFGQGHVLNSCFESVNDGVNTRQGARILVNFNDFENVGKPVFEDGGCATVANNLNAVSTAPACSPAATVPYSYTGIAASSVCSTVKASAGATL